MRALPHCVLAVTLTSVACGSPSGTSGLTDEGSSDVSEQDQTSAIEGTYSVPVRDAGLVSAATFPVKVKVQQLRNGDTRMHYTLPAELVGLAQSVDFTGSGGTLRGAAGTAACTADGAGTVCNERLPGVTVDMGLVEAALKAKQASVADLARGLDVSATFSIDPIGVLRFNRGNPGSGGFGRGRDRDR
jgi:hypothetical protein